MVKELKSGEGQTAVELGPIYDGVQHDVLQRGRTVMARQRCKLLGVMAATWNVSSMTRRSGEVERNYTKGGLAYVVLKRWKSKYA